MGFRKFVDGSGREWEIRPRTKDEWELAPAGSNPERSRSVRAPGYERDPFELSKEELERLVSGGTEAKPRNTKSPFKD
ncbi:MAG: hypothetical protein AB7S39_05965 [Gemmatimonadales bacterium]